jgi:hypothetical protein
MTWTAVKEAMELQVEACMKEEDEVAAASSSDTCVEDNLEDDWFSTITQAKRASLADETFEMIMFMRGKKYHDFL